MSYPSGFRRVMEYIMLNCTRIGAAILLDIVSSSGYAQFTMSEPFTGANAQNANWEVFGGACLTAGNVSSKPIPRCTGRYTTTPGLGALRLTNNEENQAGAIVSTTPFSLGDGLSMEFTSTTSDGNNYQNTGADGISFFLLDASLVTPSHPFSLGPMGSGLGYACTRVNHSYGISAGYLGLGVDEYGNFAVESNNRKNPNAVQLRGHGNITLATLHGADGNTACKLSAGNYHPMFTAKLPAPITNSGNIRFHLTITKMGLLTLSYEFNGGLSTPIATNESIIATNGPVPENFLFGFAGSTGKGTNFHEISCFKASQNTISGTSASSNTRPNSKIQAGTQSFLAYYNLTNAIGSLTANALFSDSNGAISVNPTPTWDASCALTGGNCISTGGRNPPLAPHMRQIFSWNGTSGIPFEWTNLTTAQKNALSAGDGTVSPTRFNYLRGERREEKGNGNGQYRARTTILGDIMHSSPTWVGAPSAPYSGIWKDALYPTTAMPEAGTGTASYIHFQHTNATRMNLVYVGANDGFLHGFRAGGFSAEGIFSTASYPNDGREMLAYAPSLAVNTIHSATSSALDYSSATYAHNAFVDATPGIGDLFYHGAWHTWLVGGLGAGGNANGVVGDAISRAAGNIYALDITNPRNTFFKQHAAMLVRGDWNSSTIVCINSNNCGQHMGSIYGTPLIRRLHDGNWAAIFGNGLNSAEGSAGIFIMTINSLSGATSFRYLDTGWRTPSNDAVDKQKNGIAFVTSADLDGDHITDFIYAGDVLGHIWRFDLTDKNPEKWTKGSVLVFSTKEQTPGRRPITTAVIVSSVRLKTGLPRVIVNFATGHEFPQVLIHGAYYASGTQAMYGVWDWNFNSWNSLHSTQYASLSAPQKITEATLTQQTLTESTYNKENGTSKGSRYSGSKNMVCWIGTSTCSTNNTKFGWVEDFPNHSEQAIYSPTMFNGNFIINSIIPSIANTDYCITAASTGYTIALNIIDGTPASAFTTLTGDTNTAGLGLGATGTAYFMQGKNGKAYLINQTTGSGITPSNGGSSTLSIIPFDLSTSSGNSERITWIQLR